MKIFHLGYGAFGRRGKFWGHILSVLLLWPGIVLADPVKIVGLGDSLMAGYGLDAGDGFVPQMQNWLTDRGLDVVLVNAGVSGDTTTGGRERLGWALEPDTDALIVELGGNDILRAIDPAVARENIAAILTEAQARSLPVLLIGITVPPNYGAAYQDAFRAIYPELAAEYGTLFYPDFLQVLAEQGDRGDTLAQWFQRDGLHPNAQGVIRIVNDMGPVVADLVAAASAD